MSTIACIIIATQARAQLVRERVLPSVISQDFDDVVLVADWDVEPVGPYAYLNVAPLTNTTTDALVKRDAGTLATTADVLVYLSDDHALGAQFSGTLRNVLDEAWDVIVPNRWTYPPDMMAPVPLNNGESEGYCGGHAGIFRRELIRALPWSAGPHDRLWDRNMSYRQRREFEARFVWKPRAGITVYDLLPENEPWK